jgi:uncharacterized protein with PQ loop repeat
VSEAAVGTAAAAWGFVMALSPVLQLHRMFRTGSSQDVSVGYFSLLVPGFLLWVAYGVASNDPFIALPNSMAALTALILITYALAMRRSGGREGLPSQDSKATACSHLKGEE